MFLYNGIRGSLFLIHSPTTLSEVLATMEDNKLPLQSTEIDPLPEEGEFGDVGGGWVIYPDERLKEMPGAVLKKEAFCGKHVTPVMGKLEEGVLLFRADWKYFLCREKIIYRVEGPENLYEIIRCLATLFNRNIKELKLKKIEKI